MSTPSGDYHDYIFRSGELIGQLYEMYKKSETIPWHQHKQADWVDVRLTTEIFKDLGTFDEIHDLGS